MKKIVFTALALVCGLAVAHAQESGDLAKALPYKVENIELKDLQNNVAKLPYFGEKNLVFFYIDPDKHKQNEAFTYEMEERKTATGPNIEGFGVLNLKDTMLPNGIIRTMARKRTEKNNAIVLTDTDRTLSQAWGLGDCNNMFVLIVVNKKGELIYCKKGELSKAEQEEFFRFIEPYR